MIQLKSLLPFALAAVLAAGCTVGSETKTDTTTGNKPTGDNSKPLKIGVVYDVGGIGDKSFNDSANRGIEKAKAELGIDPVIIQSKSAADYESNIEALAGQNCDLVIAVGLGMEENVKQAAPKFANVKFAVVDGYADLPNVRGLKFREEEGSFLAGYLSGLFSKTGKIGFVGGEEIPLIKKFQYGYWAGAKMANPNIVLLGAKYTGSWDAVDKGKASAAALYGDGADIVYHAAGRCGIGVFQAAKEANKFAIGVDSDQDDQAPGQVLTSMVKGVDAAVFSTIQDLKNGKFTAGESYYDVASGGIHLSEMKYTKDKIGTGILDKLEKVKEDLTDHSIKAPATEEEYNEFLKNVPKA